MKIKCTVLVLVLNLFALSLFAQDYKIYKGSAIHQVKISFSEIEEFDKQVPKNLLRREIKNEFKHFPEIPFNPEKIVYQAPKLSHSPYWETKEPSPLPEIDFLGLNDSGNSIPPDVNGVAGPEHLMVTLNTDTRIMDKQGNPISTVGTGSFWHPMPGSGGTFDPKIYYDQEEDRWIFLMPSSSDPTSSRLMVAVSETSDPTGNWYMYSFDGDPNNELWFDYPNFGFNKKWIVVSGNMIASQPVHAVLYVFNKSDLYNFSLNVNYSRIEIDDGFSLIPAATFDSEEEDVYIVNHAGGNIGGYGYLNLRKVTGDVNDPQIVDIGLSGIPYPWDEWSYFTQGDFVPQLGSDELINTVDARFENMVFRNNKLWCVHHIYLPADNPTRSSVQWWELGLDGTILQWGREDDETGNFYYTFASIAVNAMEDVMIGYGSFSTGQYASASYSFRYADDPPNTLRDRYQYKDGLAPYYKTFGGNRNRWGDYTSTCVDPVNDLDFWTLQQYAELPGSQDEWGTWWAKVNVEAKPEAEFTSNIQEVPTNTGVNFLDLSKFEPSEWKWIFEGGTPAISTEQNPQNIIYEDPGLFDVTLIATNTMGTDTILIEDFINSNTEILPEVYFSVSDTIPCLGDVIHLVDMSVYNPHEWLWEFKPDYVTYVNSTDENSQYPEVTLDYPLTYEVTLIATNVNGSTSLTKSDFIMSGGFVLTYSESFESVTLAGRGWTVENPDEDKTWEMASVGGNQPGGLAAYMNIKSYSAFGERDRLISPLINLSDYNEATLEFQFAYAQRFPQYTDSLIVYISLDCGSELVRLLALGEDGSNQFATVPPMSNAFYPASAGDWCGAETGPECITLNLQEWVGNPNVQIVFESYNGYGNNIFIDNVLVEGTVSNVDELKHALNQIWIFPNPSSGAFTMNLKGINEIVTIQLIGLDGKVFFEDKFDRNSPVFSKQYDLNFLKSGIYLLHLQSEKEQITHKIILR
ncbi:MAG: choice-of-anchor J domain-containing protein [Bacteroidales bacterium]|nr:choice-of-anchor J domain-containing protein [Bacteroidales bacterium]